MKYPLVNITFNSWHEGDADPSTVFLYDNKVCYSARNIFKGHKYIDGYGSIYKIKDCVFSGLGWRRYFGSFLCVYKGAFSYELTRDKISLENLREDFLIKYKEAMGFDKEEFDDFKKSILQTNSYDELIKFIAI